ncbi:hypothetical protein KFE25_010890 [Diacronema lutheri]|uniref:Tryptophan-rich sensory protein n=1 Tax=Diacronema lutheri TaxID=2081491 RepID=A0A8J6C8Q6_DIALT|nr:hypothetical protein KFE25_010890 [Diacronema lutheri]
MTPSGSAEVSASAMSTTAPALGLLMLYVVSIVVNGLVSTGKGVPLTNKDIAFTHPTYLSPPPFAFAIWGVIYLLVGAFCIVQALPRVVGLPHLAPLRPYVALALACNCGWLFLFGHELFWTSFLVICSYLAALFKIVSLVRLDLVDWDAPSYAVRLLAHCAFAANASWVTVATLLQLQLNLLDEGYFASADLSVAMLLVAVALGVWRAFVAADLPWAAVSAWALYAIRSNQQPGSDWGCLPAICESCKAGAQRICSNGRALPLGWAAACAGKLRGAPADRCVLPRSAAVASTCSAGVALVALALVAGVVRGLRATRAAKREGDPGYRHM